MDPDKPVLQEIYRLARENNKILHAMRRRAFWGGLVKFTVYAALLLGPLWFYATYLAPVVDSMRQTVHQMQGTGAKAQAQFSSFEDVLRRFQSQLGFGSSTKSP